MVGTLFGIGVGPGAPDLITLRAVRTLNEVDVIAIPRPSPYASSLAWRIAKSHVQPSDTQEHLFLTFPMSKDPSVLVPAWDYAACEIEKRLQSGKNVAFITQGDPMVYSTFIYLRENLLTLMPNLEIKIVPGVTSLSAVPAASGIPLADGQERVAIVPATYGVEDLRKTLREFDSIVLMKVASKIDDVIAALEAENMLHLATYVERATSDDERIIRDLTTLKGDKCVYFSMVLVNKKSRSGVLRHGKEALP